jgi:hypothetical protein
MLIFLVAMFFIRRIVEIALIYAEVKPTVAAIIVVACIVDIVNKVQWL